MSAQVAINMEDSLQENIEHWSLHLQRRVMRLLLLHDRRLFHGQFRTFFAESALPKVPLLQLYDRYIKLVSLSDELLDDILPRIRRQLSLQTSRLHLQEEAPTHGDIDWLRTMQRNLNEAPGLTPLRFDTRLRERSMATPENILVVAILLALRRELQAALVEGLADEALTEQERQALVGADERAERELAAPYARSLLIEAASTDIETLTEHVTKRLRPGVSPYRDLIAWWQHFTNLRIGRTIDEKVISLASKRDDEKTDAWLYELWIVLEVVHVLNDAKAISSTDINIASDTLQFTFTWNSRRFRFIYNRQSDLSVGMAFGWRNAPTSRPDYTIEREQPLKISHNGTLIWREPSVILDAKYYLSGSDPARTHGPIKKMLGDMELWGTQRAGLFFPRLPDPPPGTQITRDICHENWSYHRDMREDTHIHLYKLAPTMPLETVQARLRDVLEYTSENLPERPEPTCQGIWLDPDSINASRKQLPPTTILCPKPHIGAGVFDLVDVEKQCLKDPRLCHVIGQPIVAPFVVRITTHDELSQQTNGMRLRNNARLRQAEQTGDEEQAEPLRQQIFYGIGRAVEQYVKLRGNTDQIEEQFEHWVFGDYWQRHPRCLAPETRHILLSGEYVWHEYTQTGLDDWAAPAIQYCRALERELKRRLYTPHQTAYKFKEHQWTFGRPIHLYQNRLTGKGDDQHHWSLIQSLVAQSGSDLQQFEGLMQRICDGQIGDHRNELAHGKPVDKQQAQALREAILGKRNQPGILYCLAELVQPARHS